MRDENTRDEANTDGTKQRGRHIEVSLILEFTDGQYVDEDGEVNEDLMRREALDYAAEATSGAFDVEISPIDEVNG